MDIFGTSWENYLDIIKDDWNSKVSDDDYVLLAGDLSWAMKLDEATEDLKYLNSLKGNKIIIRGNHDYWWKSISNVRLQIPQKMYALQNDAIKVENYIFCGTRGWNVPEKNKPYSLEDQKIYSREQIRLKLALSSAKLLKTSEDDKIICLIHFPPFNSELQSSEFTKLMEEYGVDKVIYGHLHGKASRSINYLKMSGVEYFLTSCDKVDNKLVEIF